MTQRAPDLILREAGLEDAGALAALREQWMGGGDAADDTGLEARLRAWLASEAARRTTWLATVGGSPAGMASLFEYRRMPRPGQPDSRWGYIGNMYVREDLRNRGIGAALLQRIIAAGDERGYARLVLSPSPEAVPFYLRAGFVFAGDQAGDHGLLVLGRRAP